jgi:DivIVA domain-containing protein
VELKPELIERKDFPQVRRGFDPQAVQDHLYEVAKAVAEVKQGGSAASTGARVTAIVDAAERAAQELEQTARAEAERLRSSAKAEAEATLARARNEAEATLSSAKAEAETTLTNARNEADSTVSTARAEATRALTSARDEAERTVSTAKAEAEKTVTTANSNAEQTLASAKTESERMLASARREADATLSSAQAEAASTRASSRAKAQEHVERVEQSVMHLLERANAVQGDLGKLVADASGSLSRLAETVRSGADKLRVDLDVPRDERASARTDGVAPSGGEADAEDEQPVAEAASPAPTAAKPVAAAAPPLSGPVERLTRSPATSEPPRVGRSAPGAAPQADAQHRPFTRPTVAAVSIAGSGAGAAQPHGADPRLRAFNMAKSGASRDEVARHLTERFGIRDPQEIVDDAFRRSGR